MPKHKHPTLASPQWSRCKGPPPPSPMAPPSPTPKPSSCMRKCGRDVACGMMARLHRLAHPYRPGTATVVVCLVAWAVAAHAALVAAAGAGPHSSLQFVYEAVYFSPNCTAGLYYTSGAKLGDCQRGTTSSSYYALTNATTVTEYQCASTTDCSGDCAANSFLTLDQCTSAGGSPEAYVYVSLGDASALAPPVQAARYIVYNDSNCAASTTGSPVAATLYPTGCIVASGTLSYLTQCNSTFLSVSTCGDGSCHNCNQTSIAIGNCTQQDGYTALQTDCYTPLPPTASPTTASPTTASPTTASPTTASPTTASPTTASPSAAPVPTAPMQAILHGLVAVLVFAGSRLMSSN